MMQEFEMVHQSMKKASLSTTTNSVKKQNTLYFDVSFAIQEKKGKPGKLLLNKVTDVVQSGESLAIMGPSGAGKTTLLRVLTQEAFGGISVGKLTINEKPMSNEIFKEKCGIVHQDDNHWAFLTCLETITYAADLLLPNYPKKLKAIEIQNTISRLGLESCKDTIVGNMFIPGLSGGQRRRLSIAVMMMKKLEILFLDEPTSGLDAAAAASIISFITDVTKKDNLVTIFTIHQPSTNTFNSFDRILLLSQGRTAYSGFVQDIGTYFRSILHPIPSNTNPAEYLLDLVNMDFTSKENVISILDDWDNVGRRRHMTRIDNILKSQAKRIAESEDTSTEMELVDIYDIETLGVHGESSPDNDYYHHHHHHHSYNHNCPQGLVQPTRNKITLFYETFILLKRHCTLCLRDPMIYTGRILLFLVCTVFFAILYIHTRVRNQDQALNRVWFIAWCIAVPTNMGVIAVFVGNQELQSMKREFKNGMVNSISYLIANTMIQIPMMVLFGLSVLPAAEYGIMNFYTKNFLAMLLIYSITIYSFECVAQLLSAAFPNPLLGMLQYVNFWFTSFLYCGQFLPTSNIVWPLRVFSYITPFKYAFGLLAYTEVADTTFSGAMLCTYGSNNDPDCLPGGYKCDSDVSLCYGYTGRQVLQTLHKSFEDYSDKYNFQFSLGILIAIAIISKIGFFIIVRSNIQKQSNIITIKEFQTKYSKNMKIEMNDINTIKNPISQKTKTNVKTYTYINASIRGNDRYRLSVE